MSQTQQDGAGALFKAGRLADAVEAATAALKKAPQDLSARVLLAELLIFTGNLERADVILDAAAGLDPSAATVVAEFRQLIRADMARRQLRRDGRVPEFLGEPTEALKASLAALVALRAGDMAEAAKQAEIAEAARPHVKGQHGDAAFDDFRDADDIIGPCFEVLTTTGKYFWIPTERILTADFHPPKRARDLFWRRCTMSVKEGPDGEVYIPVVYGWEDASLDDSLKLGRSTDWTETAPVRGSGQRTLLVGDEALGIMELGSLAFDV